MVRWQKVKIKAVIYKEWIQLQRFLKQNEVTVFLIKKFFHLYFRLALTFIALLTPIRTLNCAVPNLLA